VEEVGELMVLHPSLVNELNLSWVRLQRRPPKRYLEESMGCRFLVGTQRESRAPLSSVGPAEPGLVAGLKDYGVESHVSTMLSTGSLKLAIGIISAPDSSTSSVWDWFIPRLGKTIWNLQGAHQDSGLTQALVSSPPEVILIDSGVVVRPNNPIWQATSLLLVWCP
jgi:hypothetical protein